MGITAAQCGHDICKAIALLDEWKEYACISQDTFDYLQSKATEAIGKEGVKYELTRRGIKVE
ncbi:unnamed protein product [marine sediment metagenome]|uniref:Uncharacterized protein n=1 Tax=marine sediment metagenome TaxID=412755 RepID=X1QCY6_9ZZZZ